MAEPAPGAAAAASGSAVVLHGLTSSPAGVEGVARALRGAAVAHVEVPLLPGHGTSVEDLDAAGWDDWVWEAEAAFDAAVAATAGGAGPVLLFGLSMGGSLACHLAAEHCREGTVAALVVVNPFIDPPAGSFREALTGVMAAGYPRIPGFGGDLADPHAPSEGAYAECPIPALLSLCEGLDGLLARLPSITCPVLIMTSREDHVVPTVSSDLLAERVSGPVERVWLERSFHVATLDLDRDEVERRTADAARKAFAPS